MCRDFPSQLSRFGQSKWEWMRLAACVTHSDAMSITHSEEAIQVTRRGSLESHTPYTPVECKVSGSVDFQGVKTGSKKSVFFMNGVKLTHSSGT